MIKEGDRVRFIGHTDKCPHNHGEHVLQMKTNDLGKEYIIVELDLMNGHPMCLATPYVPKEPPVVGFHDEDAFDELHDTSTIIFVSHLEPV